MRRAVVFALLLPLSASAAGADPEVPDVELGAVCVRDGQARVGDPSCGAVATSCRDLVLPRPIGVRRTCGPEDVMEAVPWGPVDEALALADWTAELARRKACEHAGVTCFFA